MQYIGRDPVEGAITRLVQRDPDDFKVPLVCFPYMFTCKFLNLSRCIGVNGWKSGLQKNVRGFGFRHPTKRKEYADPTTSQRVDVQQESRIPNGIM